MGIIRLTDRAVVSITGADAATLLQGLVTCDMSQLESSGIAYGALLTPQGKLLFDFLLHKTERGFAVDLPSAVVADFMKRMKLYKLRAKMDLEDSSDRLAVFQAFDDSDFGRPDPRHAGMGRRLISAPEDIETRPDVGDIAPIEDYHRRRIGLGLPEAPHDFSYGDVFPHDMALDSLGGVSFSKGCYVGQEVVSRMEHRGTARRRVVRVAAETDLAGAGTDILAGERPAGTLGSHSGTVGIAIVRLDRVHAAQTSGLELTCGGVPISVSLPDWATYTWPESSPSAAE